MRGFSIYIYICLYHRVGRLVDPLCLERIASSTVYKRSEKYRVIIPNKAHQHNLSVLPVHAVAIADSISLTAITTSIDIATSLLSRRNGDKTAQNGSRINYYEYANST